MDLLILANTPADITEAANMLKINDMTAQKHALFIKDWLKIGGYKTNPELRELYLQKIRSIIDEIEASMDGEQGTYAWYNRIAILRRQL